MNEDYINRAKHCIGLDHNKPYTRHKQKYFRPKRNYYYTKADDDIWAVLEAAGFAERTEAQKEGYAYFGLTREGLDWLGKQTGIYIHNEEE